MRPQLPSRVAGASGSFLFAAAATTSARRRLLRRTVIGTHYADERMFPVDVLGVRRSAPPDQGPRQVRRCDEAPPPPWCWGSRSSSRCPVKRVKLQRP